MTDTPAHAIVRRKKATCCPARLPPPTPSWGELLRQGTSNLQAPWIVASAFSALVIVLVLVTFAGEAIREAFDPKKFTLYR